MGTPPKAPRVLLVDDEPMQVAGMARALGGEPWELATAHSAEEALALFAAEPFDVVVSDERMPGISGAELLARLRERSPETVRIVLSGAANLGDVVRAINSAEVFRFLRKPCTFDEVALAIRAGLERRALEHEFRAWRRAQDSGDLAARHARLDAARERLWMGFQPVLRAADRSLFGYEALVRSDHEVLDNPGELLAAAEELGRSVELGRRIRDLVAARIPAAPAGATIFVNVSAEDLGDGAFLRGDDALGAFADRVVLEVTERHTLRDEERLRRCLESLRGLGYRIAVDDLGAGYAGLTTFTLVSPDVVKLDMGLIRGVESAPTQQRLVELVTGLCRPLGVLVVAEGIETEAELRTVTSLGCDLVQGYLFGRAERKFAPSAADDAAA